MKAPMRVYQPEAYENLVEDMDVTQTIPMSKTISYQRSERLQQTQQGVSPRRTGSANSGRQRAQREKQALASRTQQYYEESTKREGEHQRQQDNIRLKNKARDEEEFKKLLAQMDSEVGLVEECSTYLRLKDETVQRKKDHLHRKWSSDVFLPIQERVSTQLRQLPTSSIEAKHLQAGNDYIHTVNSKGGVYRDIIDPAEYDPLKLNKTSLRYRSRDVEDPLKKDLANLAKEKALMSAIMDTGEKNYDKDHRDMLDLLLWDKLDSTPYARYNSLPKPRSLPPGIKDPRQTSIKLDHYNVSKNPDFVKKEYFPAGKFIPELAHVDRPKPYGLDFPAGHFDQQRLHNPAADRTPR